MNIVSIKYALRFCWSLHHKQWCWMLHFHFLYSFSQENQKLQNYSQKSYAQYQMHLETRNVWISIIFFSEDPEKQRIHLWLKKILAAFARVTPRIIHLRRTIFFFKFFFLPYQVWCMNKYVYMYQYSAAMSNNSNLDVKQSPCKSKPKSQAHIIHTLTLIIQCLFSS